MGGFAGAIIHGDGGARGEISGGPQPCPSARCERRRAACSHKALPDGGQLIREWRGRAGSSASRRVVRAGDPRAGDGAGQKDAQGIRLSKGGSFAVEPWKPRSIPTANASPHLINLRMSSAAFLWGQEGGSWGRLGSRPILRMSSAAFLWGQEGVS